VERVDPSWLTVDRAGRRFAPTSPALAALPPALRAAVARGLGGSVARAMPVPPAVAAAAARRCWAHLVDMPPRLRATEAPATSRPDANGGSGPLAALGALGELTPEALARALPRLSREAVHEVILSLGSDALGAVLAHVPRRAAAALCARLPPHPRAAVWAARERGPRGAPRRAALAALQGEPQRDPAILLFTLGARPWATLLRHHCPLALRQVAQLFALPAAGRLLEAPSMPIAEATERCRSVAPGPLPVRD
jgi:hypothetical protein